MANPNIVDTTSVKGETVVLGSIPTSATTLVENTTSNSIYKISTLIISNIDSTYPYDVSILFVRGGNSYAIANTVAIPQDTSLVVLSKDISIYLKENDKIQVLASSADVLQAVCSYEEII